MQIASCFKGNTPKYAVIALAGLLAVSAAGARAENPGVLSDSSFSSSTTGVDAVLPSAPDPSFSADPAAAGQYGHHDRRRRYAREGGGIAFELGAGFNVPVSDVSAYNDTGWNLTVGVGKMFNPQAGLLLEYQFLDTGITGALENAAYFYGATGGDTHTWSFSLDPIFYVSPRGKNNVYVTGGAGIYHKSTNFTGPVCDYYYGCYNDTYNTWDAYKLGLNGGLGITHQIGWHDRTKVFAEARYLWVNTGQGGYDPNSVGRTTTIPVTFGVRY